MNKISLVNQQDDKSCVVACIAMITGKPYEEIRACFKEDDIPVYPHAQDAVLCKYGFVTKRNTLQSLYPHGIYILSVPSLNTPAQMHAVVLDTTDYVIYDPQQGRPDRKFYTYSMIQSWGAADEIISWETLLEQGYNS